MNNKMIKVSDVIKVNVSTIIKNAICFYFWDGKDIEKTIYDAIQRYSCQHPAIEKDLTNEQIKDLFNLYIDKAKKDCFYIVKHEINTSVSPKIRNFKDFAEFEELPFKNISEMQNFIIANF